MRLASIESTISDDDGCPYEDGPRDSDALRNLALPFPAAIVLAYREYESLFLPCIAKMAGKPFEAPGGLHRPGIRAGTFYEGEQVFTVRFIRKR